MNEEFLREKEQSKKRLSGILFSLSGNGFNLDISKLVIALNQFDFLSTNQCCSASPNDHGNYKRFHHKYSDKIFPFQAWVDLGVDTNDPRFLPFFEELKSISRKVRLEKGEITGEFDDIKLNSEIISNTGRDSQGVSILIPDQIGNHDKTSEYILRRINDVYEKVKSLYKPEEHEFDIGDLKYAQLPYFNTLCDLETVFKIRHYYTPYGYADYQVQMLAEAVNKVTGLDIRAGIYVDERGGEHKHVWNYDKERQLNVCTGLMTFKWVNGHDMDCISISEENSTPFLKYDQEITESILNNKTQISEMSETEVKEEFKIRNRQLEKILV